MATERGGGVWAGVYGWGCIGGGGGVWAGVYRGVGGKAVCINIVSNVSKQA